MLCHGNSSSAGSGQLAAYRIGVQIVEVVNFAHGSQLTAHGKDEKVSKFYLIDLIRPESILLITAAAEYKLL